MKIVINVICILFSLMFINAGLNKFLMYLPTPPLTGELLRVNEAIMTIRWLLPLVGAIEIIGGLLFIFPRTRALGAIVLLPIMAGIVLHTLMYTPSGFLLVGILLLIHLFILYSNIRKYLPMVKS